MNKNHKSSSLPSNRYISKTTLFNKQTTTNDINEQSKDLAVFGNYTINKKYILGKGFCSKVYKAFHNQTKQSFAIKVIQLVQIKSAVQKRFLKNQIKYLKLMRSAKNVLNFQEIFNTDTKLAIVTEICKESVYQKLRSKNGNEKSPLEREEVLKIMKDIVNGYHEMRQHNLVHRDIKPANILISLKGEAKLADLGFCTHDDAIMEDKNINVGSPLYMAPQVLKGNRYGQKADVWAIGLVFLQMMIGDLPWKSCKEEQLRNTILRQNIPSLIPSDLLPSYRQILQKSLQFEPQDRIGIDGMMKCFKKKQERSIIQIDNLISKRSRMASRQKIIKALPAVESQQSQKYTKVNFHAIKEKVLSQFTSRHSLKQLIRQKKNLLQLETDQGSQNILKVKLKTSNEAPSVAREQMSKLHFCRFLFKIMQLIINGSDNIYYSYFDFDSDFTLLLAQYILFLMDQIKNIKSNKKIQQIKAYQKSTEYVKVMNLTTKYQSNYMQYFQIKFKAQINYKEIELGCLYQKISRCIQNASEHLKLIRQELFKSDLQVLIDQEIDKFASLMKYLMTLKDIFKILKSGHEFFGKDNTVELLLKKTNYKEGIKLDQFNSICKRVLS